MIWKAAASAPETEKSLTPTPSASVTTIVAILTGRVVEVLSGIVVDGVLKARAVGARLVAAEGA